MTIKLLTDLDENFKGQIKAIKYEYSSERKRTTRLTAANFTFLGYEILYPQGFHEAPLDNDEFLSACWSLVPHKYYENFTTGRTDFDTALSELRLQMIWKARHTAIKELPERVLSAVSAIEKLGVDAVDPEVLMDALEQLKSQLRKQKITASKYKPKSKVSGGARKEERPEQPKGKVPGGAREEEQLDMIPKISEFGELAKKHFERNPQEDSGRE